MTQPHYIDPVSVALSDMREIANGLGYESILEALEDLERLKSARGAPMEAVAWRVIAIEDGRPIGRWSLCEDGRWALEHPTLYRVQALAVIPTQGPGT